MKSQQQKEGVKRMSRLEGRRRLSEWSARNSHVADSVTSDKMKLTSSKTMKFGLNDTIIGTIMNWPLNVLMFWLVAQYQIGPVMAASIATVFFFVLAIIRKAIVAYYVFERKPKPEPYDAQDPASWGV